MLRPSPWARAALIVLCLAFFVARVDGGHFHVCLDGGEPFASLHIGLDGDDSGSLNNIGKPHHDFDVGLSTDATAKKAGRALDLGIVFVVALWLLAVRALGLTLVPSAPQRIIASIDFSRLRPPLRAPPR